MTRRFVTTILSLPEYEALQGLCKKHNVSMSAYMRAIIKDAFADEGLEPPSGVDVRPYVQRSRTQGRTPSGEGSEDLGAPAA